MLRTLRGNTYPDPVVPVDPDIELDPPGPGAGITLPAHHGSRSEPGFLRRAVGPFEVWVSPATALSPLHKEGARLHVRSAAGTLTVAQRAAVLSMFATYHHERLQQVEELARTSRGMGWLELGCHVDARECLLDVLPADVERLITKLEKIGA